jgi:hypothetical protein
MPVVCKQPAVGLSQAIRIDECEDPELLRFSIEEADQTLEECRSIAVWRIGGNWVRHGFVQAMFQRG